MKPRYGHSSIIIGNNLVIFGGETPKNYFKVSEDLIVFNIDNKKFSYPRIKKGKISQRKGHICISASQTMLIQGGLNLDSLKIESSSYIFNPIINTMGMETMIAYTNNFFTIIWVIIFLITLTSYACFI